MTKTLAAISSALFVLGLTANAEATGFIQDDAAMFSRATVQAVSRQIEENYRTTKKIVHVRTIPGVTTDLQGQARQEYRRLHVNGVEILIAPAMREDREVIGSGAGPSTGANIHEAIVRGMKDNKPDAALTGAAEAAIAGLGRVEAVTPASSIDKSQTTKAVSTTNQKAPEEKHGNPWGWLLVLLSLGGIGGALYAWRRAAEKALKKPAKNDSLGRTSSMLKENDQSISGATSATSALPSSEARLAQPISSTPAAAPLSAPAGYPPGYAPGYPGYGGPVVIHDNSGSDMLTGMMVGEMMSGGHRTEVVHDTQVIHDTQVVHDAPPAKEDGGNWSGNSDNTSTSGGSWTGSSSSSSSDSGGGWGSSGSDSGGSWGGDSGAGDSGGGW